MMLLRQKFLDGEIPHQWYFNDKPCEMIGPIFDVIERKVIGLEISQDGKTFIVNHCDDGEDEFPGVTYELIH